MDSSIEIKAYTVRDLEALLRDKTFWELDLLPINKQRIISKIRNPRADKDDLALAVAWENGRVVGFGGVFPDLAFPNGVPVKAGCLTTKWVDPAKRRQGISTELRKVFMKGYNGMVYASEMSEAAWKSIDKVKLFRAPKPMKFNQLRLHVRVLEKLRKRFSLLRRATPLFSGIEMLANLPVKARLALWKAANKLDDNFRIEYLAGIDDETARFIDEHQKNSFTKRGAAELEWITRYPWVLQAPTPDITTPKFFFSTVAKTFNYIKYRILDANGQIRAFILLRLRDDTLHIPYAYFDASDIKIVAHLLCYQLIELNAARFETCNSPLVDQMKKLGFPIVSIHVRDRHTRISNELAKGADLDAITLQDGDGDKVFT